MQTFLSAIIFFKRFILQTLLLVIAFLFFQGCTWPPVAPVVPIVSKVSSVDLAKPILVDNNKSSDDDEDDDDDDDDDDEREIYIGDCGKDDYGDNRGFNIDIDDIEYIEASNINAYTILGDCDEDDDSVSIKVNGLSLTNQPRCYRDKWKATINLNPIVETAEDYISFEVSNDNDELCANVRIIFEQPKGYVFIPGLENYSKDGFFVMKYEAKLQGRKAVSKYSGSPIIRASYQEAIDTCEENGSRYDLISNDQWQTIARNIESVDENWKLGRSNSDKQNSLNCGVRAGSRQASRNDSDDCASSFCGRDWHYDRRTHILSTDEVVWDMCGNAAEMVQDKSTKFTKNFSDYIYKLTSTLKKKFGPKRTYSQGERYNNYFGLGEADIIKDKDLIVRGGGRAPGIFSVEVTKSISDRTRGNIGFRCVYTP